MEHAPLLISGAGLVGLSAALLYADRFEAVHVLEKREDPEYRFSREARSLQLVISARGWRTLIKLGLEQPIRDNAIALRGRTRHSGGDTFFEPYSAKGETISCVSRNTLHRLLTEHALNHERIAIHYNQQVSDVFFERNALNSYNGDKKTHWRYDFLIGADGVRSRVAQALNANGEWTRNLEKNHYREINLNYAPWVRDTFHYWHSAHAMIGAFPVFEGGFSVFLVHRNEHMDKLLLDPNSAWFESLFPGFLDDVPNARELFTDAVGGFLGSIDCRHWHYANNTVLVGDAAHAMLPFMGQGLNTGLEDIFDLDLQLGEGGTLAQGGLHAYIASRQSQAKAIREISEQQFRYLTGKFTPRDYALKHLLDNWVATENKPTTYMACAFSLEPFANIWEREKQIAASFTENQILQQMELDKQIGH
jgi:kynurenine 3-monooxygenase